MEGEDCHDCNVSNGQLHHFGCDMERCPICKEGQLITCECISEYEDGWKLDLHNHMCCTNDINVVIKNEVNKVKSSGN